MTDFIKKTKLAELENKTPDINSLVTKTLITTVENKIPSASSLVKKTDYDTKISELEKKLTDHDHDKYITTPEFNTIAARGFNAKLAQAYLMKKTSFDIKLSSIRCRITANKSKNESIENKLKELEKYSAKSDSIILSFLVTIYRFNSKDGAQAYLIFQPVLRYIKIITITKYISEWKSKGFSDESIKPPTTSNNSLTPLINYYGYKIRIKFNGSCLKQPKVSYTHEKVVNI